MGFRSGKKRLSERTLHVPLGMAIPESLRPVVNVGVALRPIKQHWDDLVRIAASIETGHTTATIALARFGSAAAGDPIYRAGVSFGRLVRSLYLCDYFTSEALRRTINRMLVHGEAVHQLQRAIYVGAFSKPRGQRPEELLALSGSLTLMTNLCLAWAASKIQEVLSAQGINDPRGLPWLQAISPAHFRNINLRGMFNFPVDQYRDRLLDPGQLAANT